MPISRMLKTILASSFIASSTEQAANRMPDASEVFGTPLTIEADTFLTTCNEEFNEKQEFLHKTWLVDNVRYDVDLERGLLFLTRKNKPKLVFDVSSLGSYDRNNESWEWAWNNPNVNQEIAVPKTALAPIAKKYNLKYLMSGFVTVSKANFGWYLSGIAMKVTGAIGVYEANADKLSVYLLMRNPREDTS